MVLADDCLQAATTEAENVLQGGNGDQIFYKKKLKSYEAEVILEKKFLLHRGMAFYTIKVNIRLRTCGKVYYLTSRT